MGFLRRVVRVLSELFCERIFEMYDVLLTHTVLDCQRRIKKVCVVRGIFVFDSFCSNQ